MIYINVSCDFLSLNNAILANVYIAKLMLLSFYASIGVFPVSAQAYGQRADDVNVGTFHLEGVMDFLACRCCMPLRLSIPYVPGALLLRMTKRRRPL